MKQKFMAIVTLLMFAALAVPATAEPVIPLPLPTDPPVSIGDPWAATGIQMARAFLANGEIQDVTLGYRFTAIIGPEISSEAEGEFLFNLTGPNKDLITRFSLGGRELVGPSDPPLPGFPFYSAIQIKNLNIWVKSVKTPAGTANIYGGFYAEVFKPQMPITITLRPGWLPVFVGIADGQPSWSVRVICGPDGQNGTSGADYDSVRHGFLYWVDPTVPYTLEFYDRNNPDVVLDRRGPYRYGDATQPVANDSALGVAWQGGIKIPDLGAAGWCALNGQKMESLAQDGISPAAVYGVHLAAGTGLFVNVEMPDNLTKIKVFGFVESGPLPEIPVEYRVASNYEGEPWYYAIASVPTGLYSGVVVQVTNVNGTFDSYFSRISPTGGGGGGLGKVH